MLEGCQTGHQEVNGLPWQPTLAASTQWRRGLAGSSITFEGGALRSSSKSTLWMRLRWVARVLALAKVALAHVQTGEERTVLWDRTCALHSPWELIGPLLHMGQVHCHFRLPDLLGSRLGRTMMSPVVS